MQSTPVPNRLKTGYQRAAFYFLWILLGIIQASMTELQDDEAYYWVYSKFLDWGYFDHPPLIAVLVKAGYAIFPNEFGVRLFPLLLHIITLFIIEILCRRKDQYLFYSIALSIALLQLAGFLAVPDTPLIFSTALFFLAYCYFVEKNNPGAAILLGVVSALLLYSKYHGALVILFTIVSNPRLFKNYRIYLAGLVCLALFFPHLHWQYNHDWQSFRYHLFESNVNEYKLGFTLSYIGGQLLLAGPLAGFILLPAAFLYRSTSPVERAMKFTMVGIYVFFLLSSFRGKVELNWTAPALIPLFVLAHQYLSDHPKWRRALVRILPFSLLIVLTFRILMLADLVPLKAIQSRFHAWKDWPEVMRKLTGGKPVVFDNSYQRASKYWFYGGQTSFSQNLYKEHRNQFDFLGLEETLIGKEVYHLDIYDLHRFPDSLETPIGFVGYKYISRFPAPTGVELIPRHSPVEIPASDSLSIEAEVVISAEQKKSLADQREKPWRLVMAIFKDNKWVKDITQTLPAYSLLIERIQLKVSHDLPPGRYQYMLALQVDDFYPVHSSKKIHFAVR